MLKVQKGGGSMDLLNALKMTKHLFQPRVDKSKNNVTLFLIHIMYICRRTKIKKNMKRTNIVRIVHL